MIRKFIYELIILTLPFAAFAKSPEGLDQLFPGSVPESRGGSDDHPPTGRALQ